MLSTWSFGKLANKAGWAVLRDDAGASLDAVEQGCRACEADPSVTSVGYGSYPERSGQVSLDALIMRSPRPGDRGGVCYVRRFVHAVSIARLVMERTEHALLAGEGAERLAEASGMKPAVLVNQAGREALARWRAKVGEQAAGDAFGGPTPGVIANIEELRAGGDGPDASESTPRPGDPEHEPHNRTHDTIGCLAIDRRGVLAGAVSTSGTAFKAAGRVGDSPSMGHGLYVDPDAGAAVCTGTGELMMGVCAGFLAVERMRQGLNPLDAAVGVLERMRDAYEIHEQHQCGIITLAPDGAWSSAALRPGYRTAVRTEHRDELVEPSVVLMGD